MQNLRFVSNQKLLTQLNLAVQSERESQATLLEHLAEVERRKLYAVMGYSSLWRFTVEELELSEDSVIKRIQAARLGAKYVSVLPLLRQGKLTLSALYHLYPHIRDSNIGWLINECQNKSVREVKLFLAKTFPKKATPDKLTELSENELRISFVADNAFRQKMDELKARLRHRYPNGKLRDLFSLAMNALEKELNDKAHGKRSTNSAKKPSTKPSRYLTKQTRKQVWHRDNASCSYTSPTGKRCNEKNFLEFDHKVAWALGGNNQADNLRLLCRTHNRLMADQTFGVFFMVRKIQEKQKSPETIPVDCKKLRN